MKKFHFFFFKITCRSSCPELFCKKGSLRNFTKFTGKQVYQGPFFNPSFKKRLWHRCFLVNFVKFLRTSFLQNTSGGCFCNCSYEVYMVLSVLIIEVLLGYTIKFIRIYLTNTPRIFHVETTWKRAFPYRFKVGYTWCVCKINSIVKPYIAKKTALL